MYIGFFKINFIIRVFRIVLVHYTPINNDNQHLTKT